MSFWIGLAIGAVLGFGAACLIFLPLLWRDASLERDRDLMVATLDKLRHNLDDLVERRDIYAFSAIQNDGKIPLNRPKMLSGGDHGRR